MNVLLMYGLAVIAFAVLIYMLIKKLDIKISLFLLGVVLMYAALLMKKPLAFKNFSGTGLTFLDPLKVIVDQFKQTLSSAGFIILILGGYSAYMSHIEANKVTVSILLKPVKKVKSVYILVPLVFLIGNFLSLVVPSASNLAIILLATLLPVLLESGMSVLTAAAVIATTATVMPTPLGGDNVAIAAELANTAEYAGLTVSDYVFKYHALVSIPTLLIMALVHPFWQKIMDKRALSRSSDETVVQKHIEEVKGSPLFIAVYGLLPLLPIIFLIVIFLLDIFFNIKIKLTVEVATLCSFIIALVCEIIRNKSAKKALEGTENFFKGMGNVISVVALLVAASVFVVGLKSIGIMSHLQSIMTGIGGSRAGFALPLILLALTALIVLLSGSGTALFYAMVPLMVPLAAAAGISVMALTIPLGLGGNLLRAVSPVSAVVIIVAGSVKKTPLEIVKRTSVPMIAGTLFMFIMSMVLFLK
ncbi:C4-dicarboxylate transporter DcuC [Treponema sp. Marseille-Q3903]|uniref:C4-dicarboxylate transporter DcuC n=1 Tax=Treponema sp. Marseille-Q3903 TaxID=2766703 RepID=UPI0016527217|nr:C4-dicarboxylate transporter DcuC [Treponema sp. Marseille-Q3903]MBC6713057.1 C4-dicarboxylate transporter DcuC [Treponema sp. Marseille-Q3903]